MAVWVQSCKEADLRLHKPPAVSQFTLLARTKKGTKPDFHGAMNPEEASRLYHYFVSKVQDGYEADRVKDGKFQAMMEVALVNDGPVSLPAPPSLSLVSASSATASQHVLTSLSTRCASFCAVPSP